MTRIPRFLSHLLVCKDTTQLISQLQERRATAWERVRLRWHLAACDACTRFDKQVTFLREAMRRYKS